MAQIHLILRVQGLILDKGTAGIANAASGVKKEKVVFTFTCHLFLCCVNIKPVTTEADAGHVIAVIESASSRNGSATRRLTDARCSPRQGWFHSPISYRQEKRKTMKNNKTISRLLMGALAALSVMAAQVAQAAPAYANASVSGALAPGVYGRIDIGNAPPPPLVYAQPVVIQRAPVYVKQAPMYLHVPPGQAKQWSRHCARYNACNRPVYFVKVRGDDDYERRRGMRPQPVYMHKNDWKEARRQEKEREKQEKRHWKQHEKHHRHHD